MPEAPTPGDRPFPMQPVWPGDVTRVPYWVYRDNELLKAEQRRCSKARCGTTCAWSRDRPARRLARDLGRADAGGGCARRGWLDRARLRTAAPIAAH